MRIVDENKVNTEVGAEYTQQQLNVRKNNGICFISEVYYF